MIYTNESALTEKLQDDCGVYLHMNYNVSRSTIRVQYDAIALMITIMHLSYSIYT
jgi:hypothetical protein